MRRDHGQRVQIIEREVAVARGVQAVGRGPRETQLARDGSAIDIERAARQRARAHGAGVRHRFGGIEARSIAEKRFGMREQEMRKQNRLRVLHVRHAGHRNSQRFFGLAHKRRNQARHSHPHLARGLHHEHAEVSGDEFVAAAARVQLVAERAEIFDERGLDEMVHIFSGRSAQPRVIVLRAVGDFVERGQRVAHFFDGKYACRFERARPHPVHGQLVRQQAAVERERPLKLVEQFIGSAVKPPAPQPA